MIGLRRLVSVPVRVLIGLLLLSLHGCGGGGVGKGNAPSYLQIYQINNIGASTATAGMPVATVTGFECFRLGLQARMFFTDGSSGDFTNRVVWTSLSPGTVTVSNGDIPSPLGGFFINGTLTPGSAGTAIVTANFDGITANVTVIIGTPQNLTIKRLIQGVPTTPTNNAFRMGAATTEALTATALLNGVEVDVGSQQGVQWSFNPSNNSEATITPTSGVITGLTPGGPLTAQIAFDPCQIMATTTVTVKDIAAISLQPEFGTAGPIVGNTEKYNVFADFGDGVGPEQDISTQTTLTSDTPTVLLFGAGGASNIASALTLGKANVNATFSAGGTALPQQNLSVVTVLADLESISVTPSNATIYAGSTDFAQYRAFGSYDNGTLTQEVTRAVTWTLADPTLGTIVSGGQRAGQAIAASYTLGGITNVTATDATATVVPTVTTSLTVLAP